MIALLACIKYLLSAFMMVSVAPLYLIVWISLQFPLKLFRADNLALVVDEVMYASYERFILFFVEVLSGTKVILYGDYKDALEKKESIILFANHQCSMDWIVVAMLAERAGMPGLVKFVLKQSLKFIPMYGFYFKQHGYLFVERSGKFKKEAFESQVDQLSRYPHPVWLTLFPEGHRYNHEKTQTVEKMKEYAKTHNLPVYNHLFTPRTKAISICADRLSDKVDAIYDLTIAFSTTLPPISEEKVRLAAPSYFRLFKEDVTIHMHISRIPMSEVPKGEKFDEWLYKRYTAKDELLENFYSKNPDIRGNFGSDSKTSEICSRKAITTAATYFLGSVPWLSSCFALKVYLWTAVMFSISTFIFSAIRY